MIQNLLRALPESRRTALRKELALLDQAIEGCYVVAEDIGRGAAPVGCVIHCLSIRCKATVVQFTE